jgi:hypothetical protein
MERAAWTDERLDDLAHSIRTGFARTDQDLRDLRQEMGALRTDLTGQIEALRQSTLRIGAGLLGGMTFGFLSVIAAILVRGA